MANAYDTYKLLSENPEFVEELQKLIIDDNKNESLTEDTVKTSDGKWVNKGKEGTHGKFKTKKQADAQWYRSKKGRSSMKEYEEVESIFSELESHVVSSKSLIERPYLDEFAFIEGKILETLDDGTEIELCLWTDRELQMSFWDVSIDKKIFDEKQENFLSYLKEKGLYLEDVKTKYSRWHYCGLIPNDDVYRIQYYEEEDN